MIALKSISSLFCILILVASTGCKPKKASEQDLIDSPPIPESILDTVAPPAYADKTHNSQNSLDWNGTYQGIIPCADCEGIKTSITLMNQGKFSRTRTYLGEEETSRIDEGTFTWDPTGSKITLLPPEGEPQMYQVGENILFHLDQDGNRITGDLADKYQLMKNRADHRLEDKKWILTELMGQEIIPGESQKEAFLIFNSESGRVSGNNSCNVLAGSYQLREGDRIEIGQMAATLMACPDMQIADQLNQVLAKADNYAISDGILSLNKARMAPLARFRLEE